MTYVKNYGWKVRGDRIKWEYKGKIKQSLAEEIKYYENIEEPTSGWVGVRIKEKETGKIIYERIF